MSIVDRIGGKLENVVNVLFDYEDKLVGYENNIQIKGKTLEQALKEQASWYAYYNERRIELNSIVKYLDQQLKKIRAELYVQYNENYNPALTDRAIEKYIDRENTVLNMNRIILEAQEIIEKYDMILDAFNRRGFALRDITASRVNDIHNSSL